MARELLVVAVVFCAIAGSAEAEESLSALSEGRWLAPGADIVAALSQSPGECLRKPKNENERYLVEVGRTAFRSPLLLGGPAARNGLSCNSCHRDGHGNADFFLDGLSSDAGTADVTSSLFSKSREDGVFNPLPIPTLVGSGEKQSFGTASPHPSLHAFIGSAIGNEFQGAPPTPSVLDGLAAYVGQLDANACPGNPQRETVRVAMRDVDRTLAVVNEALARGDGATADFLLLAAQRSLTPVHERFAGEDLADLRRAAEDLGHEIGALRPLAASAPQEAVERLRIVQMEAKGLSILLHKQRRKSLYDLQVLRLAVEGAPAKGD